MTELVMAHSSPPGGMAFFDLIASVRGDPCLLGYISVIERAWRELDLAGVLCLDNRPILYLKVFDQPSSQRERVNLQRLFWNQGVANILVLADPQSVYIYSGLAKPSDDTAGKENEDALVKRLTYVGYVQNVKSFHHNLATGHFYAENRIRFDPNDSVDALLLNNLRSLRDALIRDDTDHGALEIRHAHAFIGRVLFLCYLLDRGIISVGQSGEKPTGTIILASILERRTYEARINFLYELFQDLKGKFNGNMFDQDLEAERLLIRPSHIEKLTLFLGGHAVGSGQLTLGFWPYNFKMIPVETISAVYQDFLGAEDPKGQEESGAYYTPRFLAEMVVDLAINNNPDALDWTFLDFACGSGVFLVILFNRLANHWLNTQSGPVGHDAKAGALQRILERQIWGIDKEETACRIACFSLYLAYLDFFDPPDIRDYVEQTGKPLPKLLDYGDPLNDLKADIPVIYKGDSLAGKTLAGREFDCIIGNPPWEGRQSKQLAQKFMEKAPSFLRRGGTGCLLLPSKILQNQTDAFQATWLSGVSLKRVIQLADYRFVLFQDALCPAFIALFAKTPPRPNQDKVEFGTPKFNRDGLRKGIITINPTDRTWIPLSDILAATKAKKAPSLWKRRLWGTRRDQKMLDLLESLPTLSELAGTPKEGKRWIKGQGFQPNTLGKSKNPKSPWWRKSDLYIDAKAHCWDFDCIQLQMSDCEEIGDRFPSLHRPRDERIYRGPMVLVSHGFGKVAFSNFDVLFQHSLQSISGPEEDTDLLMFLTAYLRSNLAKYFLFHTSANWGSERDKVHLFELLRIPFPLPGNEFVSNDSQRIVLEVAQKMRKLQGNLENILSQYGQGNKGKTLIKGRRAQVSRQWLEGRKAQANAFHEELEPLIHRYFSLTEQEVTLVEDTVRVFIPSSTPRWSEKTVSLEPSERSNVPPYANEGLGAYADALTKTLNSWAEMESSTYRVCAEGGTDDQTGLAMVTLELTSTETAYRQRSLSRRLADVLAKLQKVIGDNSRTLGYNRDLVVFYGKQVHIVRPNILLNWTRTAALNDAARIYGDIAIAAEKE
ncbi:MAG: Eco57I restriction-modification methylase domain-containing protein [Syntrophobacteraceae bacterium]